MVKFKREDGELRIASAPSLAMEIIFIGFSWKAC